MRMCSRQHELRSWWWGVIAEFSLAHNYGGGWRGACACEVGCAMEIKKAVMKRKVSFAIKTVTMQYIVDVQGFKRPSNSFTFKEIAIIAIEEEAVPSVYVFEPPYKWISLPRKYRSKNTWTAFNYHGIPWEGGEIPYSEVQEVLRGALRNATKVYTKGKEKKRWLEKLIPHVHNLEDNGCPALSVLRHSYSDVSCNNHPLCAEPICAASNVEYLRKWALKYKKATILLNL